MDKVVVTVFVDRVTVVVVDSQQTKEVVVTVLVVVFALGEFWDAETPTDATYKRSRTAAMIVIADFTFALPSLAYLRPLSSLVENCMVFFKISSPSGRRPQLFNILAVARGDTFEPVFSLLFSTKTVIK